MGYLPWYKSTLLSHNCSGLCTLLPVQTPTVSVRIKIMQSPLADLKALKEYFGGAPSPFFLISPW